MAERSQRRSVARRCAVVLAGVLLTLTGCGMVPAYGTKAGGGVVPRHIVVATTDPPGRPASDDVKEFAHAIDKLSDGAISVEILWQAHTRVTSIEDPHAYETVGKMVRSGKVELALVPEFVWAEQGAARLAHQGGLHGRRHPGIAHLLRVGWHLQYPAAGDRRRAARAQVEEH